jgi:hypothetical protein
MENGRLQMKMTNDTYCVVLPRQENNRALLPGQAGWLKISARGRVFRMTAEQMLNHLLPALAFSDRLGLAVSAEHGPYWEIQAAVKVPLIGGRFARHHAAPRPDSGERSRPACCRAIRRCTLCGMARFC